MRKVDESECKLVVSERELAQKMTFYQALEVVKIDFPVIINKQFQQKLYRFSTITS